MKKGQVKRSIEHQMPPIGSILIHKNRKRNHEIKQAKVIETDRGVGIMFNDIVYKSMSAAARAAGGYIVDGWNYWKLRT